MPINATSFFLNDRVVSLDRGTQDRNLEKNPRTRGAQPVSIGRVESNDDRMGLGIEDWGSPGMNPLRGYPPTQSMNDGDPIRFAYGALSLPLRDLRRVRCRESRIAGRRRMVGCSNEVQFAGRPWAGRVEGDGGEFGICVGAGQALMTHVISTPASCALLRDCWANADWPHPLRFWGASRRPARAGWFSPGFSGRGAKESLTPRRSPAKCCPSSTCSQNQVGKIFWSRRFL